MCNATFMEMGGVRPAGGGGGWEGGGGGGGGGGGLCKVHDDVRLVCLNSPCSALPCMMSQKA